MIVPPQPASRQRCGSMFGHLRPAEGGQSVRQCFRTDRPCSGLREARSVGLVGYALSSLKPNSQDLVRPIGELTKLKLTRGD